jgi:hypothetical protein
MRDFRLRADLRRGVIGGFALPLGVEPGNMAPPRQGYSVDYQPGEGDDPDTYIFQIVVSHERLSEVVARCMELLPDDVYAIVEASSADAYRSVDVFLSTEAVPVDHFLEVWSYFEPFLLEDSSIGAGANAEEPFIEVFLDQWKRLIVHVPLAMRDQVEDLLQGLGLEDAELTWPEEAEETEDGLRFRTVLDDSDEHNPDLDEIILQLRDSLHLELNVDPDTNVDENDRELGRTLWHSVVLARSATDPDERGAYVSMWLTAESLAEAERLVRARVRRMREWRFEVIYTLHRVDRKDFPKDLGEVPPPSAESLVLHVDVDPWGEGEGPPGRGTGEGSRGGAAAGEPGEAAE